MSKVVIEFDTKEKTLSVAIDGVAVENVVAAEVVRKGYYYGYGSPGEDGDEEFSFSVLQSEKDKENDTTKMTRIVAAEDERARASAALEVEDIPSVRAVPEQSGTDKPEKAVADIIDYFDNLHED